MTSTIRDLTELTAVAPNDYLLISDTSDTVNRDKRITPLNLIGGSLTGGGVLATGGFTLTVPATGVAALKTATPAAGRVASWLDANTLQDGGFAVSDIARLSQAQTWTANNSFSNVISGSGGFRTLIATIANQAVLDYAFTGNGMILVWMQSGGNSNRYLLGNFRANSSPVMQAVAMGTDFNVSTATLTGTTGTAGKATISAVAGHIYIENQLGSSLAFGIMLFI